MLSLSLNRPASPVQRVLCLGAHCDDIEIGCGGTLLTLLEKHTDVIVDWIVFTSDPERAHEASQSAQALLTGAKSAHVVIETFRDGFLPYAGGEIKEYFERLKTHASPDIIFTHYRHDLHQDHRLISDLTWNTFRDHLIFEYEIPKYDGDIGSPNVFVHLDESTCRRKIDHILDHFRTQNGRQWFSRDLFWSMLRLRGMESNAPNTYAEAFYCRKAVLA